ncbi:glutamine-hydrolyzing carbamoyl-phosphate synthase small subunit [Erwinia aphidicola]|uniref:glutamine-hydrolyzing carbamoyl-phosphate synthase small subunit n=1 Tax=Erwinia sp. V90_4 TaxID=3044239 RepID=UPI000C182336|nr:MULTISPECIES: glutamine-hydrolyzing carbamoyl-phosphate synthase small subunit [Erwinia]MBD1375058.1 glutamine-hydrolyzing carbamoyl-phosphate synthase small subunit [Erwinia aphidicola]MBN1084660.1 glutamine-hydrolyzing carbamoyl-phosphate synthase small subunit [Erwinia aphidicola]MDI3439961.1 glutamine-hydrolyzing carbamoyl-phosphate synthase small subunit [Erwinia sp. V90_4]PIJ58894.1 carbamoyl-phosphate synthase small subunit [Erwinia sp. OLMDLW33]
MTVYSLEDVLIKSALLVLEDGTQFHGRAIGATGSAVGEVVFNTSMTGYQEILTDPSYSRQIVTLTYPHIGNVGTNAADAESTQVHAQGLVIRDLPLIASNYRNEEGLSDYLTRNNIVAIADIDTRKLTRLLREKGAQNGCIIAGDALDAAEALAKAKAFPGLKGMDLAKEVTVAQPYSWQQGSWTLEGELPAEKAAADLPFHVVAYDYGVKRNILRMLVDRGCRLTVVPAQTPAEEVLKLNPDGVFLSNGPGDPEPCDYAITAIKRLLETEIPIFGICLGHQLLALASGAKTVKMKLGHHGGNHPVKDHDNNTVMITAQNHGFAVDDSNLPANLRVTHTSLFDHTVQGIHRTDKAAFSFQGHPEASPGPHDAAPLFDHFIELIKASK